MLTIMNLFQSSIAKIMGKCFTSKMTLFLIKFNILNKSKYGFGKGISDEFF